MANLCLGLLGTLEITLDNVPLSGFESDKARALLIYLAGESDRPHRRESLLGLLWPDSSQERARHSLRQTLSNVRRTICDAQIAPRFLLTTREDIRFNPAAGATIDVRTFNSLLTRCQAHAHSRLETCAECAGRLEEATALYRGKFLQEFFLKDSAEFEEWALVMRESLHQRALAALAALAEYHLHCEAFERAERAARRQLELDPWREEAHRQLMRALAGRGQRSEALAQFEICRRTLADALGVEPSAETRDLVRSIGRGEIRPEPPEPRAAMPTHNLPVQLTPFVGREQELAELGRLLADPECRMITLVGPGGVGKTRLALQVAATHGSYALSRIVYVPLASLDNPAQVVETVGKAIGLTSHGLRPSEEQLVDILREKHMLLVLDNFEHLMAAAGLFAALLQSAPGVKLLVTSREPLNLMGEWVFQVGGLGLPPDERAEGLEAYDAVALFIQRARRARVGFDVRTEDPAALARICRLVDGWPLAIELAAAWTRTLSCSEIARHLESGPDLLTSSLRDLPARHRSLRLVLDESWQLLKPEEQAVLARLSVFSGGFERVAAERVAGASLSLLAALVAHSLVRRVGGDRYDLHELMRQYAREQLSESGLLDETRQAHARFFRALAQEAASRLRGPEQLVWLDRLERDHDNLRAALQWLLEDKTPSAADPAFDPSEQARSALALAGSLFLFWRRRSHWGEGRRWIGAALDRPGALRETRERARALDAAVILAGDQADTRPALSLSDEELALARALDDAPSIAAALNARGFILWKHKDHAAARALCEDALSRFRQLNDPAGVADALDRLGHITINQPDYAAAGDYLDERVRLCRALGNRIALYDALSDLGLLLYLREEYAPARAYLEEALPALREAGATDGVVAALERLGDIARCEGDYEHAGALYTEALALYRDSGDRDEIPSLLHNLSYTTLQRGDDARALALFREALELQRQMDNRPGIAECVAGVASVLIAQGHAARGARLLSAAEQLREQAGALLWPANLVEQNRARARLAVAMTPAECEAAWTQGRALTTARAIEDSLTR